MDWERIRNLSNGELIEYETIRFWIEHLPKPFFRENGKLRYTPYLREMNLFLGWLEDKTGEKWNPDSLLEKRKEQIKSDDMKVRRWVEDKLQEYYKTGLSERKVERGKREGEAVSDSTKASAINSVSSFFARNYYQLGKIEVPRRIKRVTKDYWFTIEDIREMCEVASPWERSYLLTQLSSGLRINDVVSLKWADLWPYIKNSDKAGVVGPIPLATEKANIETKTFLTPDCVDALKKLHYYQEEREKLGEYVFKNSNGNHLRDAHVNRRIKILFKRAGRSSGGLVIKSHGLRKMLYNIMKNSNIPVDVRNIIVGKAVDESIRAYVNGDNLREMFMRILPAISISKPQIESAEELKTRISGLETLVKAQASEIIIFESRIKNMMFEIIEKVLPGVLQKEDKEMFIRELEAEKKAEE